MKHIQNKTINAFLIFSFVLIIFNGCKDDYTSTVPYVPIDWTLNPTNYIELNIPLGSIYIQGVGYGGIIVFRDLAESSNPFLAYDATCTYEVLSSIRVVSDGSGVATCPTCKSQFILSIGGSPGKGPATEPLKQYKTSYNGSLIFIRN